MKTKLFLIAIVAMLVAGCGNPYLAPNASKAISEEKQVQESAKQTQALQSLAEDVRYAIRTLEIEISVRKQMMAEAGLSEDEFVKRLFEARARWELIYGRTPSATVEEMGLNAD